MLIDLPFTKVFIDNILIFRNNIKQHLNHIEQVLQRLNKNNVSVKYTKSSFLKTQVTYLGHIISDHNTQLDIFRVENVETNRPP